VYKISKNLQERKSSWRFFLPKITVIGGKNEK